MGKQPLERSKRDGVKELAAKAVDEPASCLFMRQASRKEIEEILFTDLCDDGAMRGLYIVCKDLQVGFRVNSHFGSKREMRAELIGLGLLRSWADEDLPLKTREGLVIEHGSEMLAGAGRGGDVLDTGMNFVLCVSMELREPEELHFAVFLLEIYFECAPASGSSMREKMRAEPSVLLESGPKRKVGFGKSWIEHGATKIARAVFIKSDVEKSVAERIGKGRMDCLDKLDRGVRGKMEVETRRAHPRGGQEVMDFNRSIYRKVGRNVEKSTFCLEGSIEKGEGIGLSFQGSDHSVLEKNAVRASSLL
jgi:hypothetical protein